MQQYLRTVSLINLLDCYRKKHWKPCISDLRAQIHTFEERPSAASRMELYVNDLRSQIQLSRLTHNFLGLSEDITIPMITEPITTSVQISFQKTAPITSSTTISTQAASKTLLKPTQTSISVENLTSTPDIKILIPIAEKMTAAPLSDAENTCPSPFFNLILIFFITIVKE